uniref:D-alanine--D-alanine ligase n=1 Tax=Paulinella longichromatophora TaxID=1708747 RepID=A0A2H4ZNX1_9EUKA|nr:D-alanine--D-alanine ligase [Paulinella longichromatophora]
MNDQYIDCFKAMKDPSGTYSLNIGLVFGGASAEHEVSIYSAQNLIKALEEKCNRRRYKVKIFYIDLAGYWWSSIVAERIIRQGSPPHLSNSLISLGRSGFQKFPNGAKNIDIWFPVLHGPNGEDGTIQGLFTLMKKPFVGSGVLGSAVSMDKQAMKASFSSARLPQVTYTCVGKLELQNESIKLLDRLERQIGYPCFVKPANLGSSLGISKCFNRNQLTTGLRLASDYDERMVVEQGRIVREIECAVLGTNKLRASILGEICFQHDWYDYKTKYKDGLSSTLIPAQLPKHITASARRLALEACRVLGVDGIARVDFFYSEDSKTLWINEINTLPGFTNHSMYPTLWKSSGIEIQDLVHLLIKCTEV